MQNDDSNHNKKTITKSLVELNNLISEKISFKEKKKDKKILKDLKKAEINYQQYLRHHQKMPSILVSSFRMMRVIELICGKCRKLAFTQMKKLKKTKYDQDLDLKAMILIENIEIIKRKKQYLDLKGSFRQIRMYWQDRMLKETESLESVRILSYKNKQIDHQLDIQEQSISNHILDLSVYEHRSYLLNEQKESTQNLLIRLNYLEAEILKAEIKINNSETLKKLGMSQLQEIQQTIKDNNQSNQSMKQKFSMSNLNNLECQGTLKELLEKNLALQEQADIIRVTNDDLLEMTKKNADLNPELIDILQEVRRILQPSPLGLVKVNF